jgi:alpha-amylase
LAAEAAVDAVDPLPAFEVLDLDADQSPEIALRTEALQAWVKPDEGGAVFELDARAARFNVLDLMGRREEAYHDRLRRFVAASAEPRTHDGAVNIHDLVAVKEPGLEQRLHYDVYRRGSFIDHALAADAGLDRFVTAQLPELADLAAAAYPWTRDGDGVRLERTTPLLVAGTPRLHVVKRIRAEGSVLAADYELQLDGGDSADFVFAVELAVNFRAGDAPDRWFEVPGRVLEERKLAGSGIVSGIQRIDAVDAWIGLRVACVSSVVADVWRMPIETVSMSESGFERVYQGSALLFRFPLHLQPGSPWSVRLEQRILPA